MCAVDEVYVNAGLKGRRPRCSGGWDKDVIPVFTIIGRDGMRYTYLLGMLVVRQWLG
jgi:hypothetical protein